MAEVTKIMKNPDIVLTMSWEEARGLSSLLTNGSTNGLEKRLGIADVQSALYDAVGADDVGFVSRLSLATMIS